MCGSIHLKMHMQNCSSLYSYNYTYSYVYSAIFFAFMSHEPLLCSSNKWHINPLPSVVYCTASPMLSCLDVIQTGESCTATGIVKIAQDFVLCKTNRLVVKTYIQL